MECGTRLATLRSALLVMQEKAEGRSLYEVMENLSAQDPAWKEEKRVVLSKIIIVRNSVTCF